MKRLLVEQKDCPSFSAKKEVSKLLFITLALIVVFFSAGETEKSQGTRLYSSYYHVHKAEKVWEREIYFCKSFFTDISLQTAHVWSCHWIITGISTYAKREIFRHPNRSKVWAPISAAQWYLRPWKIYQENFKIKPQISGINADPWSRVLRLFNNVLWKYRILALSKVQY